MLSTQEKISFGYVKHVITLLNVEIFLYIHVDIINMILLYVLIFILLILLILIAKFKDDIIQS